jgi:hypothetical protein
MSMNVFPAIRFGSSLDAGSRFRLRPFVRDRRCDPLFLPRTELDHGSYKDLEDNGHPVHVSRGSQ